MLRSLLLSLLVIAPLIFPSSCAAGSSGDAEMEIRAALARWTEDFNGKRTDRVCDLFAPDLIANYGDYPEKNYESLCGQLKSSLRDTEKTFRYSLDIQEIMVSGDLAVVRLVWTLTVYDTRGKLLETTKDRGMDVFRRQEDGSWRISRYLAYPIEGK